MASHLVARHRAVLPGVPARRPAARAPRRGSPRRGVCLSLRGAGRLARRVRAGVWRGRRSQPSTGRYGWRAVTPAWSMPTPAAPGARWSPARTCRVTWGAARTLPRDRGLRRASCRMVSPDGGSRLRLPADAGDRRRRRGCERNGPGGMSRAGREFSWLDISRGPRRSPGMYLFAREFCCGSKRKLGACQPGRARRGRLRAAGRSACAARPAQRDHVGQVEPATEEFLSCDVLLVPTPIRLGIRFAF